MKMLITWCKNHMSLIIAFLLIPFTILLGWVAYRSFGLEVIKAFGPVYTSLFMAYIAYGQLKISKNQAALTQQKNELDIRDKKYEVFKRWNEAYYDFIYSLPSESSINADFSFKVFRSLTDELLIVFDGNIIVRKYAEDIREDFKKYLKSIDKEDDKVDLQSKLDEINENRRSLIKNAYKELGLG